MYKVLLDGYIFYTPNNPASVLIDPVLELETGFSGTFTFTVPPTHPMYDRVQCRKSMVSVLRNDKEIFYGEVRNIPNIDWQKNKQVQCVSALSFLADSIQPQAEYHEMSTRQLLGQMLDYHNEQVEAKKKILLGLVTVQDPNNSLYRYTNYENTLEAIRDKLVNRLGGVLRLRHESDAMYLDWIQLEQYGVFSTQPIEFGLNLLNYTETITADDIVTALIPLGATIEEEVPEGEEAPPHSVLDKRVDITSVNGGKNFIVNQDAVNEFGWIWATNTWDDVHLPENLLEKARNYLAETQFERLTLTLSAADLSELGNDYNAFSEGDRIHCLARPYGMDIVLPVQKLTIPLTNPAGRTLELSNTRTQTYTESNNKNLSDATQNAIDRANSNSKVLNKEIQASIDNLTQMMNQGKGGYKVTEYDEDGRWLRDLYMDAPDKELATNIMMINEFGIGFSTTGYNGPYTTGITIDGTILGSRLVANSVSADKLSVGLNATIQGLEDGIKTTVRKDDLISTINQSSEAIKISANRIDLSGVEEFKSIVTKDNIVSTINQSSESVSISANKINLNGAVTANQYFKILTDGSMEATAGKIGGFVINSDYLAYGRYVTNANWLNYTPHGSGNGGVYLGNGGLSVDDYNGSSSLKSVQITDGGISFYTSRTKIAELSTPGQNFHLKNGSGTSVVTVYPASSGGSMGAELQGFIKATGSATIGGGASITGNTTVGGTFSVSNKMTVGSDLALFYGQLKSQDSIVSDDWMWAKGRMIVGGNLSVSGTKSRVSETESYGKRRLYAFETPVPMFSDIGDGVIDDTGSCIVAVDPVFSETIANGKYQVFTEGKGCCVEAKHPDYFVVSGAPGTEFSWMLISSQRGFEATRLENDALADEEPEKTINYEDEYLNEIEELLSGKEDAL